MMLPFALLMTILIVCCAVLPLKLKGYIKFLLALPILAATLKFEFIRLFGGPMFFAPDMPVWLLQVMNYLHLTAFFWLFGLLASTLCRGVVWAVYKFRKRSMPELWHKGWFYANLTLLLLAMIFAAWGMYNASAMPSVKHVELKFAALPSQAENCRIAVLADLHIDRGTDLRRLCKIVNTVNTLQCDLVVLPGDMVDGSEAELGGSTLFLGRLRARYGVYGIMGNHEYFSGGMVWRDHFNNLGITMLLNEQILLPNGIYLAGITDPAAKRLQQAGAMPDLKSTLRGIEPGEFTLLLAHRPGDGPNAADAGVDLQISGHTHGGMIWGFDRVVARYNNGFVSGAYQIKDMQLYVSNGTGIWRGFPIRMGRGSEITVITLKKDHTK